MCSISVTFLYCYICIDTRSFLKVRVYVKQGCIPEHKLSKFLKETGILLFLSDKTPTSVYASSINIRNVIIIFHNSQLFGGFKCPCCNNAINSF